MPVKKDFKSGTKVKWVHDCRIEPCPYNEEGGEVWKPRGDVWAPENWGDYEVAQYLGLTRDEKPDKARGEYVMVNWNCRPGVLQVHYTDELEIVKEND